MTTSTPDAQDDVICPCSGTRRSKVRALFLQGMDAQGISAMTGALTGCGGCEWDIEEYLKELTAEREG